MLLLTLLVSVVSWLETDDEMSSSPCCPVLVLVLVLVLLVHALPMLDFIIFNEDRSNTFLLPLSISISISSSVTLSYTAVSVIVALTVRFVAAN